MTMQGVAAAPYAPDNQRLGRAVACLNIDHTPACQWVQDVCQSKLLGHLYASLGSQVVPCCLTLCSAVCHAANVLPACQIML